MAIPYSTGGGYSVFGSQDFGLSADIFTTDFKTPLITAQTQTTDKKWKMVLDNLLKYGGPFLKILSDSGVIKNKNLQTFTNADYDQTALQNLLAANGGSLDKNPSTLTVPKSSGFAIDFSNPVVLAAVVGGAYLLFKK